MSWIVCPVHWLSPFAIALPVLFILRRPTSYIILAIYKIVFHILHSSFRRIRTSSINNCPNCFSNFWTALQNREFFYKIRSRNPRQCINNFYEHHYRICEICSFSCYIAATNRSIEITVFKSLIRRIKIFLFNQIILRKHSKYPWICHLWCPR